MSVYKASIYNYLFNSINSIVVIVNGIIMVPLYLHYMSVATYGAWLASGNLVAMIGILESGFAGVITQKMATAIGGGDRQRFLFLAGSNIMTAGIIAILIFFLGACFIPFIAKIVNAEPEWASDITISYSISLLSSVIAVLVSLFGAFPQVWQQTRQVGIINTCVNIVAIVVMVICLFTGLGVISLAIGYLTRSVLNLIIQGIWIRKYWQDFEKESPIYNVRESFRLLKECVYPLFARVSGVLMGQSQNLILAAFFQPSLAAIYDFTSKVISCAYGFVSMTNGSFFALLSIAFGKNNRVELNRMVSEILQFFTICVVAVFILGLSFSKIVVNYWVGLDKFGGDYLLLAIGVALLVNQYKAFFNNLLFTSGNIKKSSIIDIFSLLAYLGVLFFLIKILGVYSIPASLFLTNFMFAGWYVYTLLANTSIDKTTISFPTIRNLIVAIVFGFIFFIYPVNHDSIAFQFIQAIIYSIVFIGVIVFVNKGELTKIKKFICKK